MHKNLKSERVRVGMTQAEFASEIGISTKRLVKYEADTGTMPAELVKKASDFFGCTTDYLLDLAEERI